MRIRQVKPAFFQDARLSELSDSVRLFYIGLWLLADDAGWFKADVPEIGIALYGYRGRGPRERTVTAGLEALSEAQRIVVKPCGHGFIPTMADHQRLGGETKRVYTIKREHDDCPRIPATPRVSPQTPATEQGTGNVERNGQERNGTPRAGEPDGPLAEVTEFRARVPRPA